MSEFDISIYPLDSLPYGYSYLDWTIKWWKWLLSIPRGLNPSLDPTGSHASVNQIGQRVFFICQTFANHSLTPIRQVTLPDRCAIFTPIINWISVSPIDGVDEEQLLRSAKTKIDAVENLQLSINGKPVRTRLKDYRVTSGQFEVIMPTDNVLGLKEGNATCLSDGYWLMFEPKKMSFELSSYGSCSSGANKIGASYCISFS